MHEKHVLDQFWVFCYYTELRVQYLIGVLNNINDYILIPNLAFGYDFYTGWVYFLTLKFKISTKHSTIFLDQILMQIFYFSNQIGVPRAFFLYIGQVL